MSSAICFNLDQSKILSSCNGLSYKDEEQERPVKAYQLVSSPMGKQRLRLSLPTAQASCLGKP